MRFALIISLFVILTLSAYGQSPTPVASPAPTASPAAATATTAPAPDPMDPRFEAFYPRNEVEAETRNPGGEWRRGEYGKMLYTPPVRKHAAAVTTPKTTTMPQREEQSLATPPRVVVTVNVSVTPENNVPPSGTTTTPAVTPKKANAPWNMGWLWSTLKFLGCLVLLAAIAVGVWAVGRTWGVRAGATTGVSVAILGVLVWLAL